MARTSRFVSCPSLAYTSSGKPGVRLRELASGPAMHSTATVLKSSVLAPRQSAAVDCTIPSEALSIRSKTVMRSRHSP